MYADRIQLLHCGPISSLDITFPFRDSLPQPVLLVGGNGSGKTITLSHIVNGMIHSKDLTYPESPEVEPGKVYKLRSALYIQGTHDYYSAKVDYTDNLYVSELHLRRTKGELSTQATEAISGSFAKATWDKMSDHEATYFDSNFPQRLQHLAPPAKPYANSCCLYFPSNRFEEPAWLNHANLTSQAQYLDQNQVLGATNRSAIALSPMKSNQNWLFDLIYDRAAFELSLSQFRLPTEQEGEAKTLPLFAGYRGVAHNMYEAATLLVRTILGRDDIRFGIGPRQNRVVSVMHATEPRTLVPNIFQLSSGESSLLNLFLSILRDFDMTGTPFTNTQDITGMVLVDEIDLHLHSIHQYDILPRLIQLFPNVQFIVTTHSPLFILGMSDLFGDDGFALHRLPHGHQISPEEFSEFDRAYRVLSDTSRFLEDTKKAIRDAEKPIVFVEGPTDVEYLRTAARLLGYDSLLDTIELKSAGGESHLTSIWKTLSTLAKHAEQLIPRKVVLVHDCEHQGQPRDESNRFKRVFPTQETHPIQKGVENFFSRSTMQAAMQHGAFIRIRRAYQEEDGGMVTEVPEEWTVKDSEKSKLCSWLCANGSKEDFSCFEEVFIEFKRILEK